MLSVNNPVSVSTKHTHTLTIVVAGLWLEGAERLHLRHAAPGVVGVTRAVLCHLLTETRIQIYNFSCKKQESCTRWVPSNINSSSTSFIFNNFQWSISVLSHLVGQESALKQTMRMETKCQLCHYHHNRSPSWVFGSSRCLRQSWMVVVGAGWVPRCTRQQPCGARGLLGQGWKC